MKKQLINLDPVKEQVKAKLLEKYSTTTFMNTDSVSITVDIKEILNQYIADKQLKEPTIYITTQAYAKMRILVDKVETEIGWYGIVTKCPGLDSIYIIEDIIVYPQKVTGATCEQDENKMFDFEMSLTTEQVNHKRFHGHSHVNMGVTPSSVDEQFYQDILRQTTDYFIITITNKRNDYTTRFYDVENNIMYSDVPIHVMLDDGSALDKYLEDAKANLSNKLTYTPSYNSRVIDHGEVIEPVVPYSSLYDSDVNDIYEDPDPMVWDNRLGYIRKSHQDYLNQQTVAQPIRYKDKRGKNKRK